MGDVHALGKGVVLLFERADDVAVAVVGEVHERDATRHVFGQVPKRRVAGVDSATIIAEADVVEYAFDTAIEPRIDIFPRKRRIARIDDFVADL